MRPPTAVNPAVSVVVAAHNATATLGRCLECLAAQDLDAAFEVIVCDDHSTDGTYEFARRFGDPVRVVRNEGRRGPGSTRNAGVAAARAPVIAFTDSDCYAEPSWLSAGLDALQEAALVQGAVSPDPTARRGAFDRTVIVTHDDGYYRTANLFVRRADFDRLGGFEDWVVESGGDPPFGWRAPADGRPTKPARKSIGEDALFGWRLRRSGGTAVFCERAHVHHAVFDGTWWRSARDRWHWRHLPGVAAEIPELREHTFLARYFFNRRSLEFDAALAGVVLALATRRRAGLVLALPYARRMYREAGNWEDTGAAEVVVGSVAEDVAACASLIVGSVAWRSLLL